jgi:glycyl-tRNA synthetase alpha chain
MDMPYSNVHSDFPLLYGDVFRQTEEEYSRWNFDASNSDLLLRHFCDSEKLCNEILAQPEIDPRTGKKIVMAFPAYDQCIKASHFFNLLDARGVISVTESQAYISRVRALAKQCAKAFLKTDGGSVVT